MKLSTGAWVLGPLAKCTVGAWAILTAMGCGQVAVWQSVARADSELRRAEHIGAAHTAAYEYHLAAEDLAKARSEASQGQYRDAVDLARRALRRAEVAVRKAEGLAPVAAAL